MRELFIIVLSFLIATFSPLHGQDSTNIEQKSLIIGQGEKQTPKSKFKPNPKKALLLSLVLPGSGQIYNRDWWKTPLVYGALAGTGYLVKINYDEYQRYKTARALLIEGKPNEFSALNPTESALRAARDYYRSNFELSCVALGVVYILQGIEAYTAAHLKNFDISEDLSLSPYIGNSSIGTYYGLSFNQDLGRKSQKIGVIQF